LIILLEELFNVKKLLFGFLCIRERALIYILGMKEIKGWERVETRESEWILEDEGKW